MSKLVYSTRQEHEALEMLRGKKMIAVDKDGVLIDPSELIFQNRKRGFERHGIEFEYSAHTNYMLGGVGERYNGGVQPIVAMLAFDNLFAGFQDGRISKDQEFGLILEGGDAQAKLDALVARYAAPEDTELARRIYMWDNSVFFNSQEAAQYMRPYPGSRDALMGLVELYHGNVAIVTNTHVRDTVMRDLRVGGFTAEELASVVVVADAKKPCPIKLEDVLWERFVERHEASYLGDAVIDIKTAKRAEVTPIGVLSGMGTLDALRGEGAEVIARDLASFYSALRG